MRQSSCWAPNLPVVTTGSRSRVNRRGSSASRPSSTCSNRLGIRVSASGVRTSTTLCAASPTGTPTNSARFSKNPVVIKLKRQSVVPKTLNQKRYLQAIAAHPVTFGVGPAGTGKTYLAMAMALQELLNGTVERIILTRPAVEAGEALGFLPGELQEKILPYLTPLYDAMNEMVGKDHTAQLVERGIVEIAPLAYMRGRTLSNAFVVLDEAQNTTHEQMMMFLTRLGDGSRMVVTGTSLKSTCPVPSNRDSVRPCVS